MSAAEIRAQEAGFVRLVAAVPLHANTEAVGAVLRLGPIGWTKVSDADGTRRFVVDLRLRLGTDYAGLMTFRKAAYVDLGPVIERHGLVTAEITWRAAGAAPLFPVFAGELHADPDELSVGGLYAPPGGMVGRLADRTLLHVAATGTARWLLGELDRLALGAAAGTAAQGALSRTGLPGGGVPQRRPPGCGAEG